MIDNTIDDDRRAYLTDKYMNPPDDLALAGIKAGAEQLSRAVIDARRGVEAHNAALGLGWLNWRTPPAIGEKCDAYLARLREAQARQSRDPASTFVVNHDDRNRLDRENGWVEYDPDIPGHQTTPLGHVIGDIKSTMTVHILRAGTQPGMFDRRGHLGYYQRPAEAAAERPDAGLPNYGDDFDVPTFLVGVLYRSPLRNCDLQISEYCGAYGIGGGLIELIAVAQGRHIFAINACQKCIEAAAPCGCGECDGYSAHG